VSIALVHVLRRARRRLGAALAEQMRINALDQVRIVGPIVIVVAFDLAHAQVVALIGCLIGALIIDLFAALSILAVRRQHLLEVRRGAAGWCVRAPDRTSLRAR